MRRIHVSVTLAAAVLALGGCGAQQSAGGDFQGAEGAVAQVVEDLGAAAQERDAEEICSRILSPALATEVAAGGQCIDEMRKAVEDVNDFDLQVRDVTVSGTTARAQVRQGDDGRIATFEFAREGNAWRATSLGA